MAFLKKVTKKLEEEYRAQGEEIELAKASKQDMQAELASI